MTQNEKMIAAYDNTLLGILQNEGGLEPFLDVMFGFLSRRTDFFLTMKTKDQKFGFPPGASQKMVLNYFKKYRSAVLKLEAEKEAEKKEAEEQKASKTEVKEIVEDQEEMHSSAVSAPQESTTEDNSANSSLNKPDTSTKVESTAALDTPAQSKPDGTSSSSTVLTKAEEEDIQSYFQSNPDSYNGAVRDNYRWSQNYDDVDIKVPVSKTVKRGKQVIVNIQRKHLKVQIKENEGDSEYVTIIDDEIQHEINKEDSMWNLEGGKEININLTKDKNIWWTTLLLSEKEIDIQKICPERSMADMDEEEKAVINKLQFDDRQKKLGLPQSHEIKVHEMLKKGWDAEGSPFKGQEFDPKMFNISPGAVN